MIKFFFCCQFNVWESLMCIFKKERKGKINENIILVFLIDIYVG